MRKNFITIGSFDGVHLGHNRLIATLKDLAAANNAKSIVFTFPFPPRVEMGGDKTMSVITSPEEKYKLLNALGVDKLVKLDFNLVRNYTREEFFNILVKDYKMGGILAGRDFAFGKDRGGRMDFLCKACKERDILYAREDFVEEGGHKISSSLIRKAIKEGDIGAANIMLGRVYSLEGKIIKGRQLGRTIGFPTANLDIDPVKILPRGVYAVGVLLGEERFKGVCNIGIRPTVDSNALPSVEVHILDFDRNIYGRVLKIKFAAKIRDEAKFKSIDELKAQIDKDAKAAWKLVK
jgi:riboflavin kinase/FMN adenylyltransferase